MPSINIQGEELSYEPSQIISFAEGLIGMAHLKRMILVKQPEIHPFHWLASLDESRVAFLVLNPQVLFPSYNPLDSADLRRRWARFDAGPPTPLAIVKLAPEWDRSTVNLRAPLLISSASMRGLQIPLTESSYQLEEPLPLAA